MAYNITGTYSMRYDKVIAYAEGLQLVTAGTGDIEATFEFQVDNVVDLQEWANNKLLEGSRRTIISFDVSGSERILPWDRLYLALVWWPDVLNESGIVNVLKIEGSQSWCSLLYKVWVSDIITPVVDDYNVVFNLSQRISKLQSRWV